MKVETIINAITAIEAVSKYACPLHYLFKSDIANGLMVLFEDVKEEGIAEGILRCNPDCKMIETEKGEK